jgi:hypothetical protein
LARTASRVLALIFLLPASARETVEGVIPRASAISTMVVLLIIIKDTNYFLQTFAHS